MPPLAQKLEAGVRTIKGGGANGTRQRPTPEGAELVCRTAHGGGGGIHIVYCGTPTKFIILPAMGKYCTVINRV